MSTLSQGLADLAARVGVVDYAGTDHSVSPPYGDPPNHPRLAYAKDLLAIAKAANVRAFKFGDFEATFNSPGPDVKLPSRFELPPGAIPVE